jgi:hypothetical protein
MTRLENLVLPDCRVDLKTLLDDKVDLWDFSNGRVYLIFFSFHGQNCDSFLSSTQWFFLCPQSCRISLRIFF